MRTLLFVFRMSSAEARFRFYTEMLCRLRLSPEDSDCPSLTPCEQQSEDQDQVGRMGSDEDGMPRSTQEC